MDTKKLRQKILDLAIHGKLVPQDPNDEPASVLLERIRAEKERLVKEGKIKRSKKSASDDEIEVPFEIPESWEWVRLCDITELIEDCPHSTAKDEGHGYPLIRTPNVGEGYLILDGVHRVSESVYNKRNARAVPETNDIIYAREAPAGNAAVIKENEIVCLGQRTVLIRPFKEYINSKLLAYFIISPHSRNSLISTAVGSTATHVNLESIRPFIIPIPPLSEQIRIVWSIERWFTLIDELESNEGDLLKAIDKAKSKILDLAIHGKLVPQDPNDEPAIDLLKRINPKFETCSDSLYETLPNGWEVCIMNDIASSELGKTLDKEKNKGEYKPYLCSINVFWNHFVLNEMKQMRFEINELEHYSIHQGDLVICEGGDAGRCAVWPNSYSVLFQNAIHRVRFKENIDSYFYMYVIMYLKNKHILDNYCKGVTIKHFTKTALLSLPVPLPPINEQLRIVAKIEELFAVLDSIKESLEV